MNSVDPNLHAVIYGNGKPGLLSDVRSQGERLVRVEESSTDNNRRLTKIERMIWIGFGALGGLQLVIKYGL